MSRIVSITGDRTLADATGWKVHAPRFAYRLGEATTLTLRFLSDAQDEVWYPWERRTLTITYEDDTFEYWTVVKVNRTWGADGAALECIPYAHALMAGIVLVDYIDNTDAEGLGPDGVPAFDVPTARFSLVDRPLTEALGILFGAEWTGYVSTILGLGSVDEVLADVRVTLGAVGNSVLTTLNDLCAQVGAEWRARYVSGAPSVLIDVAPRFGSTFAAWRPVMGADAARYTVAGVDGAVLTLQTAEGYPIYDTQSLAWGGLDLVTAAGAVYTVSSGARGGVLTLPTALHGLAEGDAVTLRNPEHSGAGNAFTITEENDVEVFFSRLIPLGGTTEGEDADAATIAGAWWQVVAIDGNAITLDTVIGWRDGLFVPYTLLNRSRLLADPEDLVKTRIVGFTANDGDGQSVVTLLADGDEYAVGDWVEILTPTSDGERPMYALIDTDAEDARSRVDRYEAFNDVSPYANVLARQGVSADFSQWQDGAPVGWQSVQTGEIRDAGTVAQLTEGVQHGAYVARISKPRGGTFVSNWIAPQHKASGSGPYVSAWAALTVRQGRVVMRIEAEDGTLFPPVASTEQAEAVTPTGALPLTTALAIGGVTPAANRVRLRFEFDAGTIVDFDAATITASLTAQPYQADMGPEALWLAAVEFFREFGGIQPAQLRCEIWDLSQVSGFSSAQPIACGDDVTVTIHDRAYSTRVVELTVEHDPIHGAVEQSLVLSKRLTDFRPLRRKRPIRASQPRTGVPTDGHYVLVSEEPEAITYDVEGTATLTRDVEAVTVTMPAFGSYSATDYDLDVVTFGPSGIAARDTTPSTQVVSFTRPGGQTLAFTIPTLLVTTHPAS